MALNASPTDHFASLAAFVDDLRQVLPTFTRATVVVDNTVDQRDPDVNVDVEVPASGSLRITIRPPKESPCRTDETLATPTF